MVGFGHQSCISFSAWGNWSTQGEHNPTSGKHARSTERTRDLIMDFVAVMWQGATVLSKTPQNKICPNPSHSEPFGSKIKVTSWKHWYFLWFGTSSFSVLVIYTLLSSVIKKPVWHLLVSCSLLLGHCLFSPLLSFLHQCLLWSLCLFPVEASMPYYVASSLFSGSGTIPALLSWSCSCITFILNCCLTG